jgi:hypothetical protein
MFTTVAGEITAKCFLILGCYLLLLLLLKNASKRALILR